MSEFVINVVQDPSIIIDVNNSDQTTSLNIVQDQPNSITIEDDVNNVLLNPSVFYNGINIVYLSGVSGELLHNTFGDLQGGTTGQYYHLSSGQYFNLTTGSVVRPSETGAFYPRSNPSGFITGVNLSGYVTGDVVRPSETGSFITASQTGAFYASSNPSGFITGVNLSGYVTGDVVRPSQTGAFYPSSNPSGFITGVDLSAYVTGSVVRPSDTGNFITTAQTGAFYPIGNPSGYITGLDLSNYSTISFSTGISGYLQNQVTNLNNQTGSYYPRSNPSGFITGVDLSGYATIPYVTDVSGVLQAQITSGSQISVDTIHLYGKNDQGTTIYKGQPVYINGANGANPLIKLASNTGERTSSKTIGLLSQDLSVNQFGYIITEGLLEGFNTSAGAAGDPMWLGASGNIIYGTGNKPYGNNHLVFLGFVLRSNNNNGKVYVKPQNGFEIEELHKVYAINPSNKDTLLYNSGSGAWFARQINTGDVSGISNFVAKSETGVFYPASNPSGYITGISNLVYATGNQDISGIKNFLTQPTISGNPIATISDPVRTTLIGNGVASGFAISGASGLINPSALIVAIDGAIQEPVVDYIVNTGSVFFASPLPSGSKAVVVSPNNFYQVAQVVPSDGSVTSSKLDNSLQINNLTVANNFTLNGPFTGNSTQNNLPNQTLVNSGSILTRDLMAMFLEKDIYNFSPTSFSASTAISGASVSLNSNAIFLRGNNTTQASPNNLAMATVGTQNSDVGFMSITNSSSYAVSGGNRGGADPAYSILDFSKRIVLQFELSTNFKHVASNHNFFARLGPASSAVNTNTGQALPGTGLSIGGAYVAMLMETGSIRLVTNKNLQNPTESGNQLVSPILTSLTPFTTATAKFLLSVYSGTADLYIGNQYIGSQTGCPTHVSSFSHGIAFGCNSLAATTVVGAGYVVSNIKIITLPN